MAAGDDVFFRGPRWNMIGRVPVMDLHRGSARHGGHYGSWRGPRPAHPPVPNPNPVRPHPRGSCAHYPASRWHCLEVCIELLNQSQRVHDYECALVCALSVLGVKEGGWRDEDDYPQILSRMIKVARFMVVVKAMRLDPHGYDCHALREQRGRGGFIVGWSHGGGGIYIRGFPG
jgi:hypothetical protein